MGMPKLAIDGGGDVVDVAEVSFVPGRLEEGWDESPRWTLEIERCLRKDGFLCFWGGEFGRVLLVG